MAQAISHNRLNPVAQIFPGPFLCDYLCLLDDQVHRCRLLIGWVLIMLAQGLDRRSQSRPHAADAIPFDQWSLLTSGMTFQYTVARLSAGPH